MDRPSSVASSPGNSFDGGYLQAKQAYEEHWQRKIRDAIAYIPGAIVTVEVHIADIQPRREYTVAYDKGPVNVELQVPVRTISERNADMEVFRSNDSPQVSEFGECVEETTRRLPEHEKHIAPVPFLPESVYVAVAAPRSYLRRIARPRSDSSIPDRRHVNDAELSISCRLQSTIHALIPAPSPGEDPYRRVVVTWFDDSL